MYMSHSDPDITVLSFVPLLLTQQSAALHKYLHDMLYVLYVSVLAPGS